VTAPTPKPPKRYTVAVCLDHSTSPDDHATTEADAQLIAAAPDLLAALKSMLATWGSQLETEIIAARDAAMAAVARAEGGAR
jgi:hypothetical protein